MGLEPLEPRLLMSVNLDVDAQGWSLIETEGRQVIYVSSSQGNDGHTGLSENAAVKTLEKATSLIRSGSDDILLLRRGDNWDSVLPLYFTGQDENNPIIVSSYGSSSERPTVDRIRVGGNYQAIIDVAVDGPGKHATPKDGGIEIYNHQHDILIEGVYIEGVKIGIDIRDVHDITVRRSAILDSAKLGMFIEYVDNLIVEENILDNNGESDVLDHNIYKSRGGDNMIFRNNFLTRGANNGLKMRADTSNIQVYGNVFSYNTQGIDGKLDLDDVAAGRLDWELYNIDIIDNVFLETGYDTHQTMIYMANTRDLTIADNYFANSNVAPWTASIWLDGHASEADTNIKDFQIIGNTIYNVASEGIRLSASTTGNNVIAGNTIQMPYNDTHNTELIAAGTGHMGVDYSDNTYFSEFPESRWFKLDGEKISMAEWVAVSGDNSVVQQVDFVDPDRTLATYNQMLGGANDGLEFIEFVREMDKRNWNLNYRTDVVIDYIAEGLTRTDGAGPDVSKPTATLYADDIEAASSLAYQFSVFFNDNQGIDVSDLDNNDLLITGPNGFSQLAQFVSVDENSDGRPRTATYQITAPGGDWDYTDSGIYTITMQSGAVTDTSDNAVNAGSIGTFEVDIANPNASTVRVTAIDPFASESGQDAARFLIERVSGNGELTVDYQMSGDAAGGSDYDAVSGSATLAAGENQVIVEILPVDDAAAEGDETVTLTLVETFDYDITGDAVVTAVIGDNDVDGNDQVALISQGSVWRYLDDGSDQGTNWAERVFDDSDWASGLARLGYGNDGEITTVSFGPNANSRHITTYFRHTFNLDDRSAVESLALRLLRDDGAVVYVNGVEVFRDNMPDGAVSYDTLAPVGLFGEDETTFLETVIPTDALVNGENVIAVEIHQNRVDSSDLSFDLELIADIGQSSGGEDVTAPNASLAVSNLSSEAATHQFTVTFSDNIAIDTATLGNNDLLVTGPNGYSQYATRIGTVAQGNAQVVTYQVTGASGDWQTSDNGSYTISVVTNSVRDTSGNAVAAGSIGTFNVSIQEVDDQNPIAALAVGNLTDESATHQFTVTYADNEAIDVATLGNNDLLVTGPNGYSQYATLVDVTANGSSQVVTYQVTGASGDWQTSDNGSYTISVVTNSVRDTSGNAVAAGSIGTFTVDITEQVDVQAPTASVSVSNVTAAGAAHQFTVTFNDNVAIDVATLGNNDVLVTGPNGYSQYATLVDATTSGTSQIVTYEIDAPDGTWQVADNGVYAITVVNNSVRDTSGLAVAAGQIGSFNVALVVADGVAPTAVATAADITHDFDSTHEFTVVFSDNHAIDISSIDSMDVIVRTPDNETITTTLVGIDSGSDGSPITATYRVAVPGGSWAAVGNGTYNIRMAANQVTDVADNAVASGIIGSFRVNIAPVVVPVATADPGAVTDDGGTSYTFSVIYQGDAAIDITTIGSNDVMVTGPNNFSQIASVASIVDGVDPTTRIVNYRIDAPGGSWDLSDNGDYAVWMAADSVYDVNGTAVEAGEIGNFEVIITDQNAPLVSLTEVIDDSNVNHVLVVTYLDDVAIDLDSIDGSDLLVTGPNSFAETAALIPDTAQVSQDGQQVTVRYRVAAPGGEWDFTDNGTYTVALQNNQVCDSSGNFTAGQTLGQFAVNVADNVNPTAEFGQIISEDENGNPLLTVMFSDESGITLQSINDFDIRVTGPGGFNQYAQLFDVTSANDGQVVFATYQLLNPYGQWEAADNGTYSVSVVADQVSDLAGNAVVAGQIGTFVVNIELEEQRIDDNVEPTFEGTVTISPDDFKQVTWTDADGTEATLSLSAGTAIVAFDGENMDWILSGTKATITGDNVRVTDVALSDTTSRSSLTVKARGGDNFASVDNITADGAMSQISARVVNLLGSVDVAGALGKLYLNDITGAQISVGDSDNPRDSLTISAATVTDSSVTSGVDIKSITATQWLDTDAQADVITADSVGSVSIKGDRRNEIAGDFQADLQLAGGVDIRDVVKSVKVAGTIDGSNWQIAGQVGSIAAGSIADWTVDIDGAVKSLKVTGDFDNSGTDNAFTALSVGSVSVGGNLVDVDWTLTQAMDARLTGLKSVSVKGVIDGGVWQITGNVGTIKADSIASQWSGVFGGDVKSISTKVDFEGDLTALAAGSLSIGGNLVNAQVTLTQEAAYRTTALKSLKLKGDVLGGGWDIEGHVGSLAFNHAVGDWAADIEGDVKSLKVGGNLVGDFAALSLGSLSVRGDMNDVNLTLTQAVDPKLYALKSAKVTGSVTGGTWDIEGNAGSLSAGSTDVAWSADIEGLVKSLKINADMAGQLSALSLGSLSVRGNLNDVDLTLTQAVDPKLYALKSAKITGQVIGGQWIISGHVGTLYAGDFNSDFTALVAGDMKTLSSKANMNADITVRSIKSMSVKGDMTDSDIILTQTVDAENTRLQALGKMTVSGWMVDSSVNAEGHIGSVTVDGMSGSDVTAGVDDAVDGLPDELSDFDVLAKIGSFSQKGIRDEQVTFIDSSIAAALIGKVSLRDVQTDNGDTIFGIAADEIGSYSRSSENGTIKFRLLMDADVAEDDDDYMLRVV